MKMIAIMAVVVLPGGLLLGSTGGIYQSVGAVFLPVHETVQAIPPTVDQSQSDGHMPALLFIATPTPEPTAEPTPTPTPESVDTPTPTLEPSDMPMAEP